MLDIDLHAETSYTWENFKSVIRSEILRMELPHFILFNDTKIYRINDTYIETYRQLVDLLECVDSPVSCLDPSSNASEMYATAASTSSEQLFPKLEETKPISYSVLEQASIEGVITLLIQSLLDSETPEVIIPFLRKVLAYAHLIQAFQQKTADERLVWLGMQNTLIDVNFLERITLAFILNDYMDIYVLALQDISLGNYYWYVENTSYYVNGMERALLKGNESLALFFKAMGVHLGQAAKRANIYMVSTYCDSIQNLAFNEDVLSQVKETKRLLSNTTFEYHTPIIYDIINDVMHFTADSITDPRLAQDLEGLTKKVALSVWCFIYPALLNPMLLQVLTYAVSQAKQPLAQISNPSMLEDTLHYIIEHVHKHQAYTLTSLFMQTHHFQSFTTAISHLLKHMPSSNEALVRLVFAILPPAIDEETFKTASKSVTTTRLPSNAYDPKYQKQLIQHIILLLLCGLVNDFHFLLLAGYPSEGRLIAIFKAFGAIHQQNISQESLRNKALRTIYRTEGFASIPNAPFLRGCESYSYGNPLVVSMRSLWQQSNITSLEIRAQVEDALGYDWVHIWSSFCSQPLEKSDVVSHELSSSKESIGLHIFDNLENNHRNTRMSMFFDETYRKLKATYSDIPLGFLALAFAMMKDISMLKLASGLQPLQQEWQTFSTLPSTLPKSLIALVEQGEQLIRPKHPLQPLLRTLLFLEQATTLGDKTVVKAQQALLVKVYHKLLASWPEHTMTSHHVPTPSSSQSNIGFR